MHPHDLLIVGPYVGEFGWELMNWQGRVRRVLQSSGPRSVIICAPPDRRTLFDDVINPPLCRFCPLPATPWPGRANDDHRLRDDGAPVSPDELNRIVRHETTRILESCGISTAGAEWFLPDYRSLLWPTTADHQSFRQLGRTLSPASDVVLVPRSRHHAPERNQPEEWWQALSEKLSGQGLIVRFSDTRLDRAVAVFSSTLLAAGASTGGLHLASLCACPHYVWGSGSEERWTRIQMTNRQRYETIWNPLGTPCRYDEIGWQPSVDRASQGILAALDKIGRKTDSVAPRTQGAGWRVRRGLARILEKPASQSIWPWRIREFVRNRLV